VENFAQKFQGRLAFLSVSCRVILARPLPRCDAKHQQERTNEGEWLMGATKTKYARWRTLKFKRRPRKLSKPSETSRPQTMNDNESAQAEEIDRLLLSSLRFWEVERDLIEERLEARGC